jgi:hypothetical protein
MNEDPKLEEAEFFLQQLADSSNDPSRTRWFASALLSAARSALQYAHKEVTELPKPGGQAWYEGQVGVDPVVKFLRDHRDINIHHRPLPMQTNVTIHMPGPAIRLEYGSTGVYVPVLPDSSLSTTTYAYKFKGWSGPEDVVTLCRRYIDEIKRIVLDGRSKGFLS